MVVQVPLLAGALLQDVAAGPGLPRGMAIIKVEGEHGNNTPILLDTNYHVVMELAEVLTPETIFMFPV